MADQNKVILMDAPREIVIDFGDICRFCLTETKNGASITDKCPAVESNESEPESVFDFLTKLRIVQMKNMEIFPSKICQNCYELITLFHKFSHLCQKSDALLQECYENTLQETKIRLGTREINKPNLGIIDTDEPNILSGQPPQIIHCVIGNLKQLNPSVHIEDNKQKLNSLAERLEEVHTKLSNGNVTESVENKEKPLGNVLKLKPTETFQSSRRSLLKFQCKTCSKSFTDPIRLKRHEKLFHNVTDLGVSSEKKLIDSFFCFQCSPTKQFQTQKHLLDHFEECHSVKQTTPILYSCSHCPYDTFKTRQSVSQHLEKVHNLKTDGITWNDVKQTNSTVFPDAVQQDVKPEKQTEEDEHWNCPECSASYSRKQSLHCHMREKHNHTNLGGTKCPECSETFLTNRRLIQHGITVHQKYFAYFHHVFKKVLQPVREEEDREKTFECDICGRKYIYKTSLRKHILGSHLGKSGKDSVACPYCGKTVSSRLNLKSHIEFIHEALFVSCPICKKQINFRTIGRHYKTHRSNGDGVFPGQNFLCNLCGKVLKSKRSFDDHQKLHQNIRDEICEVCGSGFTTKKLLRLHKKTHEGAARKVFRCDQCEKVFSGRHTLNRHLLTHSGKKNFICEMCSKCFYTIQELNRHVRYHKKEYRFDCQLCDMRFLCKSRFRHHMMKHRNVRPHKCQFCEKMFIERAKMNLHMAAKHNVEVHNSKTVWKDPKTYVPLDELL